MIAVEIELSKWLYNAILSNELLTISPDYFQLRKPIERRIYEIARKHCGDQELFKIGLEKSATKGRVKLALWEFRRSIREIVSDNHLPITRSHYPMMIIGPVNFPVMARAGSAGLGRHLHPTIDPAKRFSIHLPTPSLDHGKIYRRNNFAKIGPLPNQVVIRIDHPSTSEPHCASDRASWCAIHRETTVPVVAPSCPPSLTPLNHNFMRNYVIIRNT